MPDSLDRLLDLLAVVDRRLRFIEGDIATAERLQAIGRYRHLIVVPAWQSGWHEEAVASSWPLPPLHNRLMETVDTGGRL